MSYIFPIGGGKGGIGKTFIVSNIGAIFAKQGKSVVLVDLDLGGSNLHTFFGIKGVKAGLHNFLNKSQTELSRVVESTRIPNLSIISSMNCSIEIPNLFHAQKLKIIRAIQNLPFDIVILDLGAGTNSNTLDFFLCSDEGIFVVTPEPTSIENAFRFVQGVYFRKLKQLLKQHAFDAAIKEVNGTSDEIMIKSPDVIEKISEHDPEQGKKLQEKLAEFNFKFILNLLQKQNDEKLGEKIEKVCNRHFYSNFQFLGNIRYDPRVYDSILSKQIYIEKYAYTMTSTDLQNIVKNWQDVNTIESYPDRHANEKN